MIKSFRQYRAVPSFDEVMSQEQSKPIPSFDEVMGNTPTSKKKDVSPLGKGAGLVGNASKNIGQNITTQKSSSEVPLESDIKIDDKDPVKSILTPLRDKYNVAQKDYDPYRNRMVSDQTSNRVLPLDVVNTNAAEVNNKQIAEKVAQRNLTNTQAVIDRQFDDVNVARKVLETVKQKHGGIIPDDNETGKAAKFKIHNYNTWSDKLKNSSIAFDAIDEERKLNPAFDKQYMELVKNGDDIPRASEGKLVSDYMARHAKDLQAFVKENPDFKDDYEDLTNNFNSRYPEAAKANIARKVNQAIEDKRSGLHLAKIGNGDVDKIAGQVLTPDEQKLYNEQLKGDKSWVKSNDFLNSALRKFGEGFESTKEGVRDVLGTESLSNDIYAGQKKQAESTLPESKGIRDIENIAGDFLGTVGYMAAGSQVLKAAGLPAAFADKAMVFNTFYHDTFHEGEMKFADKSKATVSAIANTGMFMVLSDIFPAGKVSAAMEKLKPTVDKVIKDAAANESIATLKGRIADAVKATVTGWGKGVGEMNLYTEINKGLDSALGLKGTAYEQAHPDDENFNVTKQMLAGGFLPNLIHGVSRFSETKPSELSSAIESIPNEQYKNIFKNADDNQKNEFVKNIAEQINLGGSDAENARKLYGDKLADLAIKTFPDAKTQLPENGIKQFKQDLENNKSETVESLEQSRKDDLAEWDKKIAEELDKKEPYHQYRVADLEQQKKEINDYYDARIKQLKTDLPRTEQDNTDIGDKRVGEVNNGLQVDNSGSGETFGNKKSEVRTIIEPPKPIEQMNSQELYDYAVETKKALRKQDAEFENKSEKEKEDAGYYDIIDNVEDLKDTSTKINFVENSENINDLAKSARSVLDNIKKEPTQYDLAILNSIQKRATELGIEPNELIKETVKEVGNRYNDKEDAEFMMRNAIEKLIPKEQEQQQLQLEQPNENTIPTEEAKPSNEAVNKIEQPTEEAAPTNQPIGNGEPPRPPEQKAVAGAYVERPKTELSHRGLQDVANEFSLEDVQSRDTKSDVQLRQDAENTISDWKEKGEYGKKVEELTQKAEDKGILTDEERVIMEQHIADVIGSARDLDKNSKEYDDKLKEIKRLKEAGEKTRSAAGAALRIPSNSGSTPRTLEDAMVDRMNSAQVEELTPEQKADVEAKFSEYEKSQKQADDKIAELQQKNAELQAELEIQQQKKSTPKNTKKDFKKERQDIRNSIKDKWAKAANDNTLTAVPLPYAKQLVAIAPDVAKLMKSYVAEGITTFSEMIDKLHEDVRGVIPEIKREDVVDMIAGKYDEPKQTKADLMEQLKKIKDKNSAEAIKIKSKIASGDFAKPQKPKGIFDNEELKKKHPELYKQTLDAIRRKEDAKHEMALANLKAEMANRTRGQKLVAEGGKVLRTAKALKAGIDFSATLVQNLLAIMAHPITGAKGIGVSFKDLASADRFERKLAELHNSSWWRIVEGSELSVVDPKSLRENEKNDIFNDTYFDDMKIKGRSIAPTKPFERQFTSLGNFIRLNLFLRKAEQLYDSGKTFESHPEDFKSVAATINNMTGRGTMTKSLENHNELLSSILWSPRLLASTLNVLGIGDAALALKGEKGFYRSLTPSQRSYAAKEIAKGIGMGIAVMTAIAYATGGKADLNPTSVTFGTVQDGDYRWTVFGRFTSVVRMLAMLFSHQKTTERGTQELDATKNGATTGNEAWKFIRGKMNPSLAFGVDIATNQMYSGEKPTVKKELANMLYPMSVTDIVAGIKQDGMKGFLIRGIPSTFGAKVSNENDFIQQNTFEQKAIINGENRVMTDDEFKTFAKKKKEIEQAEIEKFKKLGAYVVENNQPVYKSYSQMTTEQRMNKTNTIVQAASKKAKELLFGKQQETKQKENADKKAKLLNDKLYK